MTLLVSPSLFSETQNTAKYKKVLQVLKPSSPHMVGDGFRVCTYFPGPNGTAKKYSPFVLLDYHEPYRYTPSPSYQRGVRAHPHRGFETVSIVYDGAVAHRDSNGGGGVIHAGDVQWMTAASGVLHEELHEKEFSSKGGVLHAIQLWVNLPSESKMSQPKYQTLVNSDLGVFNIDDRGSQARVIAGDFKGTPGPAKTFTPMEVYDLRLKKRATTSFILPSSHNTLILVTQGSVKINNSLTAKFKDLISFSHYGDLVKIDALQDSMVLVLSGDPIDEPVVQSGPFVMTSQKEIDQAYRDLRAGKFGKI